MQGWIKLHRKILNNEIWSDVTTFRLFILLLLMSSHKDGVKIRGTELKRGQYLRSYSKLAEDLEFREGRGFKKVSKSTIKRSVQKLIEAGIIEVSETDNGTVFTIVKYEEYQGIESDKEDVSETDSDTKSERTKNEDGTKTEQEQELEELKNDKKDKRYSRKQVFDEDSVPYRLANLLYQKILENNPNHKKPDLQKWADHVRLMIERDNRTEEQITYLINWVQNDDFWKTVVLSTGKLREQFDKLVITIKAQREKVVPLRKQDKIPRAYQSILDWVNEGGERVDQTGDWGTYFNSGG